jgi:hypothetical protein
MVIKPDELKSHKEIYEPSDEVLWEKRAPR